MQDFEIFRETGIVLLECLEAAGTRSDYPFRTRCPDPLLILRSKLLKELDVTNALRRGAAANLFIEKHPKVIARALQQAREGHRTFLKRSIQCVCASNVEQCAVLARGTPSIP